MTAVTLSELSLTTFAKALTTLKHILEKAAEHAKSTGVNPDSYVTASLHEDMNPLGFQVQVVSNTVKKSVWRLTGNEVESWADDESTMAQLISRTQRTQELLAGVSAASVDGKEDNIVELQMGKAGTMNLPAKAYVLNYAMPNMFFHLQTAYAILRTRGVPLGKTDYLTSFMAPAEGQ